MGELSREKGKHTQEVETSCISLPTMLDQVVIMHMICFDWHM